MRWFRPFCWDCKEEVVQAVKEEDPPPAPREVRGEHFPEQLRGTLLEERWGNLE